MLFTVMCVDQMTFMKIIACIFNTLLLIIFLPEMHLRTDSFCIDQRGNQDRLLIQSTNKYGSQKQMLSFRIYPQLQDVKGRVVKVINFGDTFRGTNLRVEGYWPCSGAHVAPQQSWDLTSQPSNLYQKIFIGCIRTVL